MKFRLLLYSMVLSVTLCAALHASGASHIDQASMEGWLRSRITAQLENRTYERAIPIQLSSPLSSPLQLSSGTPQFSIRSLPHPLAGSLANIRINDPLQESGEHVQNGTSSAVSGQNIVVAYNDIG